MTRTALAAHRHSRGRDILRRVIARAGGDTSGVAAIEFGIVVPILVLMVVATVDIGMGFYRRTQVENAAQAGAQWAMKNGFDVDAISSAVTSATDSSSINVSPSPVQFCGCATGTAINTVACGITCPTGVQAGTYTTVSAQMVYNTILPYGIFPSTYNFTSQSTARLQ